MRIWKFIKGEWNPTNTDKNNNSEQENTEELSSEEITDESSGTSELEEQTSEQNSSSESSSESSSKETGSEEMNNESTGTSESEEQFSEQNSSSEPSSELSSKETVSEEMNNESTGTSESEEQTSEQNSNSEPAESSMEESSSEEMNSNSIDGSESPEQGNEQNGNSEPAESNDEGPSSEGIGNETPEDSESLEQGNERDDNSAPTESSIDESSSENIDNSLDNNQDSNEESESENNEEESTVDDSKDQVDNYNKLTDEQKQALIEKIKKNIEEINKRRALKEQRKRLNPEKKEFEEHEEEQYELSEETNNFLKDLGELPSFENRERGAGYSIDTTNNSEVPESVIRTLITRFLNQRFCNNNTDLNIRSNSLEKSKGFYKWEVKDVIVHLKTHQVTKVLTDKYGYEYAQGSNENVPLSFYFDYSGSMSEYSNMLAVIAIELLKKDVKVLVGFNERINTQIDSINKNIDVAAFADILESAGDGEEIEDSRVKAKWVRRDIDNYLKEKKAEKVVVFSDFDPRYEVINLSHYTEVYWFCFESSLSYYDISDFNGFIYKVQSIKDLEKGLALVSKKRFETLCYADNPKSLQKKVGNNYDRY